MSVQISGLAQLAITVADLDRAVAFYRDVLGLQFLFSAPPGLAFLQAGDTRLMLEAGTGERGSHPAPYFRVPDVRPAAAELERRGVKLVSPAHVIARLPSGEVWLCHFEDPDGHLLSLLSEGHTPSAGSAAEGA